MIPMQNFFWVTFANRASGTVEAKDMNEALVRAARLGDATKVETLPYPANPRLDVRTDCPSLCYSPNQCKGNTACPKNPSCCS
jgi:hypothetical protein